MSGFLDRSLNTAFKCGLYNLIVLTDRNSCELMLKDCTAEGRVLSNHEEKIRNHLLENYLNNDQVCPQTGTENISLRFLAEVPEHYDLSSDTYSGRIDIKVVSVNWFANSSDYYTIECKRIDGTKSLSKKYVVEGVCRFLGNPALYPSYHNKNLMLAFLVNNVDRAKIFTDISSVYRDELNSKIIKDITIIETSSTYFFCESKYTSGLLLGHLFYGFSTIVA